MVCQLIYRRPLSEPMVTYITGVWRTLLPDSIYPLYQKVLFYINEDMWYFPTINLVASAQDLILYSEFESYTFELLSLSQMPMNSFKLRKYAMFLDILWRNTGPAFVERVKYN